MKAKLPFFIVISFIFCACNQKDTLSKILSTDALTTQIFNVNKNRDTTLVTKSGIIVQLKKESLESDSANIKLEIKEALTN